MLLEARIRFACTNRQSNHFCQPLSVGEQRWLKEIGLMIGRIIFANVFITFQANQEKLKSKTLTDA
jgi:hypothetical protein